VINADNELYLISFDFSSHFCYWKVQRAVSCWFVLPLFLLFLLSVLSAVSIRSFCTSHSQSLLKDSIPLRSSPLTPVLLLYVLRGCSFFFVASLISILNVVDAYSSSIKSFVDRITRIIATTPTITPITIMIITRITAAGAGNETSEFPSEQKKSDQETKKREGEK
jgi:hypothetical protein